MNLLRGNLGSKLFPIVRKSITTITLPLNNMEGEQDPKYTEFKMRQVNAQNYPCFDVEYVFGPSLGAKLQTIATALRIDIKLVVAPLLSVISSFAYAECTVRDQIEL